MPSAAAVLKLAARPEAGWVGCIACRTEFLPVYAFDRWSPCPKCAAAAEPKRVAPRIPAAAQPSLFELAEKAGGNPWRFKHTFASLPPRPGRERAIDLLADFAEAVANRQSRFDEVQGVLVWGETGSAKTELLHCVLYELLAAGLLPGKGVRLVDARTFVAEVQATYKAQDPAWPVQRRVIETDVLLVDDPFLGKVTADVFDIWTTVLNRREGRPTVMAMNPDPNSIERRWGSVSDDVARLVSRLGAFKPVKAAFAQDGRFLRIEP